MDGEMEMTLSVKASDYVNFDVLDQAILDLLDGKALIVPATPVAGQIGVGREIVGNEASAVFAYLAMVEATPYKVVPSKGEAAG